jgi:phage terminase large subunit-like protein
VSAKRERNTAPAFSAWCEALGQPLEPHEQRIARAAFGRERELAVLLSKGNGKTRMGARLAVRHLLTARRPHVVIGAGSRDQARVAFEQARSLVEHRSLRDRITVRHLELRGPGGGLLRVLASDGSLAHGPDPSLCICDELWAHRSPDLYEAMRASLVKRPDARLLVLSTAPRTPDSPLGRLRARALSGRVVRRGVVTDARAPGLRLLEWALDAERDDLDDLDLAAACNPASWITRAMLAEQQAALPRAVFLQFHACVMGAGEGSWLPAGAWTACKADYEVQPGEPVYVGVDVGGSRASTAIVAVTEDLRVAAVEVFQGDDAVLRVPDALLALARRYTLRAVYFDPWRFQSEALRLERDHAMPMIAFPQSHSRMVPASERLHAAIVERRLRHPGQRDLDRAIASAIAKRTGRGWRLDKASHDVQIDAAVALAAAVEAASYKPEPVRLLGWL